MRTLLIGAAGAILWLAVNAEAQQPQGQEFTNADLSRAVFTRCNLTGAKFLGCDLREALWETCDLSPRLTLKNWKLTDSQWYGMTLAGGSFQRGAIEGLTCSFTRLADCRMQNCDIRRVYLYYCDADALTIDHGTVTDLRLQWVTLRRGRWDSSDLSYSRFENCSFNDASFYRGSFEDARFRSVSFRDAVLENCDIRGLVINGVRIEQLLR